jgi:hypothetical protein
VAARTENRAADVMADIENSNLTQFARDALTKGNDDVLAGKPL